MEWLDIGSVVAGAVAGLWLARRSRLSGKLALAFALLPFAAVGLIYLVSS